MPKTVAKERHLNGEKETGNKQSFSGILWGEITVLVHIYFFQPELFGSMMMMRMAMMMVTMLILIVMLMMMD